MTRTRLLLESLRYHGRGNLAVALGAAVGAAVLAGALLVGDSLRGSLRARTERQLNDTEHALTGGQFFRERLAAELPGGVRPVILLQGTVRADGRRAGRINVLGVDARYGLGDLTPTGDGATVSDALAKSLDLRPGASLAVTVQKSSAIPRSSALAKRDTVAATQTLALRAEHILPPGHAAGEFTLSPNPATPLNLTVPLEALQKAIDQPGRVNTLLSPAQPLAPLQEALEQHLTLGDWGLKVHVAPTRQKYISVESRRLILEPAAVTAALNTAEQTGCMAARTFVYLANGIAANGAEIPYSAIAAVEPGHGAELNPVGEPFADDEIVLVDWKDSPLKVKPGDQVTLTYFKPEVEGRVEEESKTFRLKALVPLQGSADDPDLVPEFPGITDRAEIRKWDPPFPYDNTRIKPRDEKYWREHRTTPKAYVTLNVARQIWGSRFGDTTSVRLIPKTGDAASALPRVQESLLKNLDAKRGGFEFDPVRERLLAAGQGSTDFGLLFLAFSFFLIVAALMLVGLLFRLNLERRAREVGLLRAAGYPLRTVRRQLLVEGLIVSALGSAVGLAAAIAFAAAMLAVLAALWPTQSVGSFLRLHVTWASLVIGFGASVVMSELAVWWAVRGLSRIEPSQLLKGVSGDESTTLAPSKWGPRIAVVAAVAGIALLAAGPFMPAGEPQAGTFFGGGALLLVAGLALVWTWLRRPRHAVVHSRDALGVRNATRNPTRSVLTAGLLAAAAFLLVAVESFRREPDRDFREKTGGSGGFPLLAESDSPVFVPLNGETILNEIEDALQKDVQNRKVLEAGRERLEAERKAKVAEITHVFHSTTVYPFRLRTGDDASCLNLYQALRPRVLGVPDTIIDRGGFQFASTEARSPEEKANPWLLLRQSDDTVPAFVEENTATWQLKKGLGDVIEVPDEEGRPVRLRIAGLLKDSVFQSEVLIGNAAFRKSFPRTEGFSYFLIDVSADTDIGTVQRVYEDNLAAYGVEVTKTSDRVASYLAVQNTYLSTFQLLGGFGLLLGVLGLAVVLLRNVWERRSELALLRAMGYRAISLNRLVFVENAVLLVLGLGAGVLAALVAVAPHLAGGGHVPWLQLLLMLGAVLVVGLVAAGAAVAASRRTPILEGLRQE
ncbi:MAG TPA: ABC transporter permease [Gemmataceae bacterium]|nr:ABC transporter permease [Gemmataceae bacterium]